MNSAPEGTGGRCGLIKTDGWRVVLVVGSVSLALVIIQGGVGMQVFLVVRTLQDRWPLGDIAFGVFFFVIGQVMLYAFSSKICMAVSHYLDGLFFATICNLLGVMMIYKYWDSITKEDLEFSVGTRMNNWEVKELLPEDERRATMYADDPYSHGQSSAHDHALSPTAQRFSVAR